MKKNFYNLECDDFNLYPHYVYCTAFLVDEKVADYKICDHESCWGLRTFRGTSLDNKLAELMRNNSITTSCKYNKILVNNEYEHNLAFEKLEDWIFSNFEMYPEANLSRYLTRKED